MFAIAMRPFGREYRCAPYLLEKQVGCQEWLPKSRQATGLRRAANGLGRRALGDGFAIRRDDSLLEIIVCGKKKTPRREARGSVSAFEDADAANNNAPASISNTNWWGRQVCTCRGAGQCLCCRRFDRAIRAHQARVATAGGF